MLNIIKYTFIIFLLVLFFIPVIVISIIIKIDSNGPVIQWSKRVGINNKIFKMPKFRTMYIDTLDLPTHLLDNPKKSITRFGFFLRKTSLDEIPQIYSVLINDMNFIGPRPALHNQYDLINLRTEKNIHTIKPGITGLAQVEGRDDLTIKKKVEYDNVYFKNKGFKINTMIIIKTLRIVIIAKYIKH